MFAPPVASSVLPRTRRGLSRASTGRPTPRLTVSRLREKRRYSDGLHLRSNAAAVRWYRLAAEQGNADAQCQLGFMSGTGEGVLKDPVLAHMWFNIVGANEHEDAREQWDDLERDMTGAQISRATALAWACMASGYQDCEL